VATDQSSVRQRSLRQRTLRLLEAAYSDFHSHYYRARDPVSLVHNYKSAKDREVAALVASTLSYGNVATILTSVSRVLTRLGPSPYRSVIDGRLENYFEGFRHRFTTGTDISILTEWIGGALRSHGSIESFFLGDESNHSKIMRDRLSDFVRRLEAQPLSPALQGQVRHRMRNLKYLVSDPVRGSACKRLNMFLRWMVRSDDGIDLGLWRRVSASSLMLPVDTHLLKTLHLLKWTRSKQATWRVVEAATAKLRLYAPDDPIRYDFALCHLSMEGRSLKSYAKVE
jgi:uncharacterized protein (TIGR02757 family)